MFSLTYSKTYDPYHTVFRLLALVSAIDTPRSLSFETLRIVDFYHNFPWLLGDFRAYTKIESFQKDKNLVVRKNPKSKFEVLPDKRVVFQRMLPSQLSAKAALAGCKMFELNEDEVRILQIEHGSRKIAELIREYGNDNRDLLSFLMNKLANVPLLGPGGLKERSGLGEFRYDVV